MTNTTDKDAEFEKITRSLFEQALVTHRPYNEPKIRKLKDWHDEDVVRIMAIGYSFVIEGLRQLGYATSDDEENFNETALRAATQ